MWQGSKGSMCYRDSEQRERVATVISKTQKEGRVALGSPSATARLAPKSLSQYLLSAGGTSPSLLGLGVIRYCPCFSRQGYISSWSKNSNEAPGTTRPFARDAVGDALPGEQLFLQPPRARTDCLSEESQTPCPQTQHRLQE